MEGFGSQIIVGATAIFAFATGYIIDVLRQRARRKAELQDERLAVYSKYLSATIARAGDMVAMLSENMPDQELLSRMQEREELVGPLRLHANEEIRSVANELADAAYRCRVRAEELHTRHGHPPYDAVMAAWASEMRPVVERLEVAMKRHIGLKD